MVSVSVPAPIVAVALVIVAASLATSARAMATARVNCPSVSDPCRGVVLEGSPSARLVLLAHPLIAMVATRQAAALDAAGITLGRGGTTEWFHEKQEPALSRCNALCRGVWLWVTVGAAV